MKLKKLTVALGIVSMIAVSGFSQMGGGRGHRMGKKGGMRQGHMMKGKKKGLHKLAMLAGANTIMEKYQIKIKRVHLDAKESTIDLRNDMKKLHMTTVTLAKEYDKNPTSVGKKIAANVKEQRTIAKKLKAIRTSTKKKVQALKTEMHNAVEKKIDAYVNKLGTSKTEMKKFVDLINSRKGMNCPKGMGSRGGKGTKGRGNRR